MPTFTSYPDPKEVGSVAQDDKGWSWIWNGSAWDSQGFVQQFNPFAGFTGPFMPATTDPTAITVDSVGNGIQEGPFTRGGSGDTIPYGDTTLTQGAWIAAQSFSSGTTTSPTGQSIFFVAPWVGGNTFWEGTTARIATASSVQNSGFYSAFNGYATDGAYDMTNDVLTSVTTNRRFSATDRLNSRDTTNPLDAQFVQLGTNQFDTNSNAFLVDQFVVTIATTETSNLINNDSRGNTYEFRRGPRITQGFWQDPSPTTGVTTRPTSGLRYVEYNVYPLYIRETTP